MTSDTASSIFLIGPMGAGKTTIGRALARALDWPFIDSDREIEQRTGATINVIFDYEGEDGFRARETAVLDELTQRRGIVLATGGGAVLRTENRGFLSSRGRTIYLHATVEQQLRRTAHDKNRPLLRTPDRRARLVELFNMRDPLYRATAHVIFPTDRSTPARLLHEILHWLDVTPAAID